MALRLITGPAVEPVSVDEAKQHSRIEQDEEDAYIEGLIKAARESAETFLGRALITQTWELALDSFTPTQALPSSRIGVRDRQGGGNREIAIPRPRLQAITSVKYIDLAGAEITFTDFETKKGDYSGSIRPLNGSGWPPTKDVYDAVKIVFTAGYGDEMTDIPEPIRQAIKMTVAEMYERRENVVVSTVGSTAVVPVPQAAEYLMWPYRVIQF